MSTVEAEIKSLPATAARMVAVEILLADPEALGDDVLESCLYVPRETACVMTIESADPVREAPVGPFPSGILAFLAPASFSFRGTAAIGPLRVRNIATN